MKEMSRFGIFLSRTRHILVIGLIAILPFHALIATIATDKLSQNFPLTLLLAWKEVFAILLILVCGVEMLIQNEGKLTVKRLKIDIVDVVLGIFILLALIFGVFQETTLGQWAHGMRIDVLPFALLVVVRRVSWPNKELYVKVIIGVGLVVAIFGVLQAAVFPPTWLAHLGYSLNKEIFVEGAGVISTGTTSDALSSCPLLEHTSQICRAISSFGGPTRFGVYLLVVIGLLLGARKNSERVLLLILLTGAAALTYSRSVWLGLVAMGIVFCFIKMGQRAITVALITGVVVIGAGALSWTLLEAAHQHNPLKSVLVRVSSTQAHYTYMKNGVEAVMAEPLGRGVGTVGAASARYKPFLTENWFLQVFVEMGVIGGVLFLILIGALLRLLYQKQSVISIGLFIGVVGVCVAGLFTHSFEELAASYTMVILAGLELNRR